MMSHSSSEAQKVTLSLASQSLVSTMVRTLSQIEKQVEVLLNAAQKDPQAVDALVAKSSSRLHLIPMQITPDSDVVLGTVVATGPIASPLVSMTLTTSNTTGNFWHATVGNTLIARKAAKSSDPNAPGPAWEINPEILLSCAQFGSNVLEGISAHLEISKRIHEAAGRSCQAQEFLSKNKLSNEVVGSGCEEARDLLKQFRLR